MERAEHTENDDDAGVCIQWKSPLLDLCLQFAGGLCHFWVGLSVEGSADESSSIHQLWEVYSLKWGHKKKIKGQT